MSGYVYRMERKQEEQNKPSLDFSQARGGRRGESIPSMEKPDPQGWALISDWSFAFDIHYNMINFPEIVRKVVLFQGSNDKVTQSWEKKQSAGFRKPWVLWHSKASIRNVHGDQYSPPLTSWCEVHGEYSWMAEKPRSQLPNWQKTGLYKGREHCHRYLCYF